MGRRFEVLPSATPRWARTGGAGPVGRTGTSASARALGEASDGASREKGRGADRLRIGKTRCVAPRSVRLSSPDRVLFPDEGITKRDLFEYYRAVAPVLVPHLRNRPFTMKRSPYGVAGEAYFQKQAPRGMPPWIPTRTFRTYPRGGGSRLVDFPLVNSPEAVLWMVQRARGAAPGAGHDRRAGRTARRPVRTRARGRPGTRPGSREVALGGSNPSWARSRMDATTSATGTASSGLTDAERCPAAEGVGSPRDGAGADLRSRRDARRHGLRARLRLAARARRGGDADRRLAHPPADRDERRAVRAGGRARGRARALARRDRGAPGAATARSSASCCPSGARCPARASCSRRCASGASCTGSRRRAAGRRSIGRSTRSASATRRS